MKQAGLIPSLQSDALAREIEQQFKDETQAVVAAAERDAHAVIAQARGRAHNRVREAILELRREGSRRLARAKAQLETENHVRAQRESARAVEHALPLLREALAERWRNPEQRKQWVNGVAQACALSLRKSSWLVEHPADWSEPEQNEFMQAVGAGDSVDFNFKPDSDLAAGLRIKADQAVLDATPDALLCDSRTIAAMLLDEIGSN